VEELGVPLGKLQLYVPPVVLVFVKVNVALPWHFSVASTLKEAVGYG
jgi:hypothetical protein